MNDREKFLAAAVATLVLLWGATTGWKRYQAALESNLTAQRNVAQELSTVRAATARGRRAQQRLRQWQRQSLPADLNIARSRYEDWLRQQLTAAGLQIKELNPASSKTSSNNYQQLPFKITALGELAELTEFLHRFYQARHLHRISQANIAPSPDRKALTISLTVDGLLLADTDRQEQLAEGTTDALKQTLAEFRSSIVSRNVFAAYEPPKPPRPPQAEVTVKVEEGKDIQAAQAKFSGIHYGQGGWLMSIRMQDSGKVLYYHEGDKIEIGRIQGTIELLDGNRRRAVIATDLERIEIHLGKTLAEAQPLSEVTS